jgi:hypothetical protein
MLETILSLKGLVEFPVLVAVIVWSFRQQERQSIKLQEILDKCLSQLADCSDK